MELRSAFPAAIALGALLGTVVGIVAPPRNGEPSAPSLAIDAVTRIADVETHWDLPVVWNSSVERFVSLFRDKQADRMALYLKRSGRYEGMIRSKLRERGMPEDLVYLSMIESGFLPSARSRVGAVGLWQLMSETARDYGLRVDGYVDERRDPIKSTDAALRHLSYLHRQFGSWSLAAAAYNSGEGRVGRAMRAETGELRGDESAFWRIRRRLPAETREYVPLIYAAALVGKEPQKYGLGEVERWTPLDTDTVRVAGGTDLEVVAEAVGMNETDLRKLNPHLLRGATPPGKKGYPVNVPSSRARLYAANLARLRVSGEAAQGSAPARTQPTAYTVQRGETLGSIAREHGTSVVALQRANGISARSVLQPGQLLRLPSDAR